MVRWERTVNLPAEKVYKAILDYIRAGSINYGDKVERFSEPSYIEVKTAESYILKVYITPQGPDRCQVLFDFYDRYKTGIIVSLFLGLIMGIALRNPWVLIFSLVVGVLGEMKWTQISWIRYKNRILGLLESAERSGVVPEFGVKVEVEVPDDVEALYKRLVDAYNRLYGSGKLLVEHEIKPYMSKGLSREEAITKLAEREGIAGRIKVKKTLPVDDLYNRLMRVYISRSREILERKIEEYIDKGLSRREAIKRIAEEEGIT